MDWHQIFFFRLVKVTFFLTGTSTGASDDSARCRSDDGARCRSDHGAATTVRDAEVTTVRPTMVRDAEATTVRDADATTVQDATVQEDTATPYQYDIDCAAFENSTSENSSEGWGSP